MYKTLISAKELNERLDDKQTVIIDCRYDLAKAEVGREQYQRSHIKGALFADIHDDLSGPALTDHGRHPLPSETALNTLFSRLGIQSHSQVVVYDASGGCFAARFWWLMRYMGHEAVALLDGGWQAWLEDELATSKGVELSESSEYSGSARLDRLVTLANIDSAKQLIDSRDPARYRGEVEPIDRVAGHIPGAKNHFWNGNIDADLRFKSPQDLKQRFSEILEVEAENAVFYCGSGVTACHNLLAVCHAGLSLPRLYAGSWSEWCSDESRPVATGTET